MAGPSPAEALLAYAHRKDASARRRDEPGYDKAKTFARAGNDNGGYAPESSIGTMAASLALRSVSEVLTLRTLGAAVSRSTNP